MLDVCVEVLLALVFVLLKLPPTAVPLELLAFEPPALLLLPAVLVLLMLPRTLLLVGAMVPEPPMLALLLLKLPRLALLQPAPVSGAEGLAKGVSQWRRPPPAPGLCGTEYPLSAGMGGAGEREQSALSGSCWLMPGVPGMTKEKGAASPRS